MPSPSRLTIYSLFSTSLFLFVTLSALNSRPNFYAAAVAVGRSNGSMMVLGNFGICLGVMLGVGVKKVFFGTLRSVEYEHLFERLWMFLTESLLALTIFRDDFSSPFAIMYGLLVFLKCFHWITADRVDYMDQIPAPGPPTLFHVRAGSIITLLSTLDILLVCYSLDTILTDGVSAMVLFASEFAILLASIWGTMARYVVSCMDLRRARGREDAPAWEQKSMYMFYIDLAVDFAKLLTYLVFFSVILLNYGIPLHILRDVWMTFRSFASRCSDLVRYRRATRDLDAQYPNATEEDVGRLGDRVCIICREEMRVGPPGEGEDAGRQEGPNETPKKLVCGHVFHFHCLRSWLERQQSCPTCRRDVLQNPLPTTRNRRPAPPAPGAVPVPPGNLPPNDQMRAQFNQFFRLPQENGAMPLAPEAPVAVPNNAGMPGITPTTTVTSPTSHSQADAEVQRSIWGGPIQPGRFFGTPLGAVPRQRYTSPPIAAASSSRSGRSQIVNGLGTPAVGSTDEPLRSAAPAMPSIGALSAAPSEVNTPFSSNPPEVFRSISRSPDPAVTTEEEEAEQPTETRSRRLAAEAAMRRLGIDIPSSVSPTSRDTMASSSKGKEKARPPSPLASTLPAETLIEQPQQTISRAPYITIPRLRPPHPIPQERTDFELDRLDKDGIDDRLRTLRVVDDTIWTLIEDLTKLKSQWEVRSAEDMAGLAFGEGAQRSVEASQDRGSGEGIKARRPYNTANEGTSQGQEERQR